MKIKLETLLSAMETEEELFLIYYDVATEKLEYVPGSLFAGKENKTLIEQIEKEPKRYLAVPVKSKLRERNMMKAFMRAFPIERIRKMLAIAIRGKMPFIRFKEALQFYGIEEQWYGYRKEALREQAISWCREHHIEYEE